MQYLERRLGASVTVEDPDTGALVKVQVVETNGENVCLRIDNPQNVPLERIEFGLATADTPPQSDLLH